MAFDGITIAAIRKELGDTLTDGRIYKITQPEADELLLTVKNNGSQYRLVISANASLPLIYLTQDNKVSPVTAPSFCMLLRKHILNGRIISITQPDFERILVFEIEHLNELGDLCRKKLIVELMGKYSNIIFVSEDDVILDSIKHVSAAVSSVREVLPGKPYFVPRTQEKSNPLTTDFEHFSTILSQNHTNCCKALLSSFTGVSSMIANEICYRAGLDDEMADSLTSIEVKHLFDAYCSVFDDVQKGVFSPAVFYENDVPVEYACVPITSYTKEQTKQSPSACALIKDYYAQKEKYSRSRQKSADLRKIVTTILERDVKKYDLQCRQLKDTEKMDDYRIYGELLQTYGYSIAPGAKSAVLDNYYTNEKITVPLDPQKSALDNSKRYFEKYGKCKRTKEALNDLIVHVKEEIDHLESILNALDIAEKEEDLNQIKEELIESGYICRKGSKVKQRFVSKPFHYRSKDGFDIYVGKNNYQNEELTFKFASGNDWWFHAKGIPGSHVILKTNGLEVPDSAFEEAGRLAAHYSKGRGQEKVEIDYTPKKNVKKTPGGKPGFVIYHTNYSLLISSDITGIEQVEA
ncbi:MAG: NFACT family protein [Lachnospiraceae bacterium]